MNSKNQDHIEGEEHIGVIKELLDEMTTDQAILKKSLDYFHSHIQDLGFETTYTVYLPDGRMFHLRFYSIGPIRLGKYTHHVKPFKAFPAKEAAEFLTETIMACKEELASDNDN